MNATEKPIPLVVTIDGPAGAGKSSVGKKLAERLNIRYLDTGAMYRAVTWVAMQKEADWSDIASLVEIAANARFHLEGEKVEVNGVDVTESIRSQEVTNNVCYVADQADVRTELIKHQRALVSEGSCVTEGRDQGSVAFPDATIKFYLTATPKTRAKRRQQQLEESGTPVDFKVLLKEQEERDKRDKNREVGALVRPDDAVELDSDRLTFEEVVEEMSNHVLLARANQLDGGLDDEIDHREPGDIDIDLD